MAGDRLECGLSPVRDPARPGGSGTVPTGASGRDCDAESGKRHLAGCGGVVYDGDEEIRKRQEANRSHARRKERMSAMDENQISKIVVGCQQVIRRNFTAFLCAWRLCARQLLLLSFMQPEVKIIQQITVYRKTDLPLKPAVAGAMMWAVGLEKAMLTYFEMAPDTQFPVHSHEAEQITLVLEGELTFAYDGKETTLRPGEVIAIPSNVKHSAKTGSAPCKAVDAWSPVRKEYL